MNEKPSITSAAEWYTAVLKNGRKAKLPPGYPQSQPPSAWPPENAALFERYLAWLIADGAGHTCITSYYLPVAGHVLGYHLQPHAQLHLERDLERVMEFLRAKQVSERWLIMGRHALTRFRRFMQAERGESGQIVHFKQTDVTCYHEGLPSWLVEQITRLQHIRQANWRPARLNQAILRFWSGHTRLWRWLFAHESIQAISDIKRTHLFAYIDERLAAGYNPKSVNQDVRAFQSTLHFLQERDFAVPRTLLRLPGLKEPDSLPRFLTDEQVGKLQTDLEQRVAQAQTPTQQRNAWLDRAAFYLLWQGGLRLGEVEELRLDDLNISTSSTQVLAQKQLVIRQGKGRKDRAVYLTDRAIVALQAYLAVRGSGATDHVFLYRHQPVCKDLLRGRLKAAGERTGVKVTPHQLRHTYATQLLNAGCQITTIQALLGHKHSTMSSSSTTLTYARVHDRTVAEDYYAAMAVVEKRLSPHLNQLPEQVAPLPVAGQNGRSATVFGAGLGDHQHLLNLIDTLHQGDLDEKQRTLVAELRQELLALAG